MSVQTSLPPKSEGSQLSGSTHKPAPILQCLQPSSRHHNQKYWRPAADNPSGRRSLRISAADSGSSPTRLRPWKLDKLQLLFSKHFSLILRPELAAFYFSFAEKD